MVADDDSVMIDNHEDLGTIKERTHYKVTFPILIFTIGVVFFAGFTAVLIVGLADTELAKIQTTKETLVRDNAFCLAIKAAMGFDDHFRCRVSKNVGHLHTLAMVAFALGWSGLLCIWASYDWIRLWNSAVRGRENDIDPDGNATDTLLGTVYDAKLALLRPHEYHMATMIYHDTSEFKWLIRTLSCVDLIWMIVMTGVVGQSNVFLFVWGAIGGFLFSILRYGMERTNRRSESIKVYGMGYEPGMIRNFSQPIGHLLLMAGITAILASMYAELLIDGHPPPYVLALLLIYIIYIWVEAIASYIFLWATRGQWGEKHEDKPLFSWITNREFLNILQWIFYAAVFVSMSIVLIVISRHEHLII